MVVLLRVLPESFRLSKLLGQNTCWSAHLQKQISDKMVQGIEPSKEGSTHLLIEGSQPEQRSLDNTDLFLARNYESASE
ncbi:hypothetical protein MPTK2_3g21900 [Marchantia polymorpha subsp. ruderalis]